MSQYNLVLIQHEVDQKPIYQRAEDGYVNATEMCQAAGKKFNDYHRTQAAQAFISELSSVAGIPATELIQVVQGGDPQLQGTWVHPKVAINLAQWCSPTFAVKVSEFIYEWMQGINPAQQLIQHWSHYLNRTSLLYRSVPQGYFSIFHEAAPMIIAMIQSGVMVDSKTVPDISIGKYWSKYWNENLSGTREEPITYDHYYPDNFPQSASNPQATKAYPDSALPDFRRWLTDIYLVEKFPKYINTKQRQGIVDGQTANLLIDTFGRNRLN